MIIISAKKIRKIIIAIFFIENIFGIFRTKNEVENILHRIAGIVLNAMSIGSWCS